MPGKLRLVPLFSLLAALIACRYQPVWETTPGPTPLPSETFTPGPTATATSLVPTAVVPESGCLSLDQALQSRWTEVRNTRYGYSLEIPISWAVDDSAGDALWVVISDPRLDSAESGARSTCGLLRIYVIVDSVENWVGWVPDPGYQPVQVNGHDGWRLDSGSTDATQTTQQTSQISVSAGDYYYRINLEYTPSDGSLETAPASPNSGLFTEAVDTILATFKITNYP